MKNTEIDKKGDKLILTVDLTKTFGPSSSGKSIIIASFEGNQNIGDIYLGMNVYRKNT